MKLTRVLYYAAIIVFFLIFLFSAAYVLDYFIESRQQQAQYDELAAMVEEARSNAAQTPARPSGDITPEDTSAEAGPTEPPVPTEPVLLPEYEAAYNQNNDMIGWMYIDGTNINYPVMQTPDRENYYLKRNFNKAHSERGCLYVRESCDVFMPSDNVTIYGHHMNDGTMFADLDHYVDPAFWEEYHTINFDTLYTHQSYTIFAVFTTTASLGKGFSYHLFENADNASEFDAFVSTCKELALYETGITPQYGDKLICLSTCEYTQINGRLVVAAVRNED